MRVGDDAGQQQTGRHPVVDPQHVGPQPGVQDRSGRGGRCSRVGPVVGTEGHGFPFTFQADMPVASQFGDQPGTVQANSAMNSSVTCRSRPAVTRSAASAPPWPAALPRCQHSRTTASWRVRRIRVASKRARQEHPLGVHDVADHAEARRVPTSAAIRPAARPSTPNSTSQAARICRRVAPRVFRITASWVRRRWPAATAPDQHQRAGDQGQRPGGGRARRRPGRAAPATAASTSSTRMPVTLGSASVTARSRPPWSGPATRTVAMWVCGACASRPGLATMTKFSDERLPGDVAQAGDLQVDVAAQHVDPDGVADAACPSPWRGRHRTRPAAGRCSRAATSCPRRCACPGGGVAA